MQLFLLIVALVTAVSAQTAAQAQAPNCAKVADAIPECGVRIHPSIP